LRRYQRYADIAEKEEEAAEGGVLASISSLTSGSASSGRRVSIAEEMSAVGSPHGRDGRRNSFRGRTASFMDYLATQQHGSTSSDIHATGASGSSPAGDDTASDGHRDRVGSMRERVGSRRASFAEFAEGSIGLTAASEHDHGAAAAIPEDADLPEPPKPAPSVATHDTPAPEASKKSKHGLVRWVEAGKFRIWLIGAAFYPIAQTTRIMSDTYVRWWTENLFGLTQQGNLETYSILVGGLVYHKP